MLRWPISACHSTSTLCYQRPTNRWSNPSQSVVAVIYWLVFKYGMWAKGDNLEACGPVEASSRVNYCTALESTNSVGSMNLFGQSATYRV